jgi:hypothetical protein
VFSCAHRCDLVDTRRAGRPQFPQPGRRPLAAPADVPQDPSGVADEFPYTPDAGHRSGASAIYGGRRFGATSQRSPPTPARCRGSRPCSLFPRDAGDRQSPRCAWSASVSARPCRIAIAIHHRTVASAAGPTRSSASSCRPDSQIGCPHIFRTHGGCTHAPQQTRASMNAGLASRTGVSPARRQKRPLRVRTLGTRRPDDGEKSGLRFRPACRSPCPTRPTSRNKPVRPGNRGGT